MWSRKIVATKPQSTQFELCPLHLGNLKKINWNPMKEEYNMKNIQILNFSLKKRKNKRFYDKWILFWHHLDNKWYHSDNQWDSQYKSYKKMQ